MIISASRRTDIPAFYGSWFLDKLRRGFCEVKNPFNAQVERVALDKENVDGFFIARWRREEIYR